MSNAKHRAAEVIFDPKSIKYHEDIRMFQGCPTLAVTHGGRIFLGWYAGGLGEPCMDNYNLLVYSDDQGKSWSKPLFVIPSCYENNIHALDIQLFTDPNGVLHVQWVQNNVTPYVDQKLTYRPNQPLVKRGGYIFHDFRHYAWEMTCENPDAAELHFSEPKALYPGFLRCKPTFLKNGHQLHFAYDQLAERYVYQRSEDGGKTFTRHTGSAKRDTFFDETMAYEMKNGDIRMLARTTRGELAQSISHDGGYTWDETENSGIVSANTRFYISRLPSGRVLLVTNDHPNPRRQNMTICLSEDDGLTWKYKVCIDEREEVSYPDADICGDTIYLTYDRERMNAREILFTSFTEDDIIQGKIPSVSIVSKPPKRFDWKETLKLIADEKLIAILRNTDREKLIPLTEALYAGGIRLVELPFTGESEESDRQTADTIRMLTEHWQDKMLIGAGTVMTEEQVWLAGLSGAKFIFSPDTKKTVIRETYRCGMISIPGAYTPTEVTTAMRYGAHLVKLFPAEIGGPAYLKAILKPLRSAVPFAVGGVDLELGAKLIAVGGVNTENFGAYLDAGAIACGVGESMFPRELLEKEDYAAITKLAEQYTKQVKNR